MQEIKMMDLKNQYVRLKPEIDEAVQNVLSSGHFIGGKVVAQFAENFADYTGAKHIIPCGNGTDALQISLMGLDLQAGDEVIVPSFTYIATAEVIALLGGTPIFVEVDEHTFTLDPQQLESAISSKTKAIIVVHLYGQCANMEEILAVATQHNLPVIEDGAQSIGSSYTFSDGTKKQSGTMGEIGTTSFFPTKNLGAYGDGGAIMTNNDELAKRLKMIANHGQSKKYYHDIVGVNSRLDTLQAAILDVKLRYLDEFTEKRRAVAKQYDEQLNEINGIKIPHRATHSTHVFHQYTLTLDERYNREELMEKLAVQGVPTNVYYPLPQHLQKGFIGKCRASGDLSLTEKLSKQVFSIPMHTELAIDQIDYVCNTLKNVLNDY